MLSCEVNIFRTHMVIINYTYDNSRKYLHWLCVFLSPVCMDCLKKYWWQEHTWQGYRSHISEKWKAEHKQEECRNPYTAHFTLFSKFLKIFCTMNLIKFRRTILTGFIMLLHSIKIYENDHMPDDRPVWPKHIVEYTRKHGLSGDSISDL
jgi:hypothetical protein